MGCCFCCLSNENKVDRVLEKFQKNTIYSLDRLEPGPFPQSFSGKVIKHEKTLVAPVSGKQVVYYNCVCEEEVEEIREVMKDGKKEREVHKKWVHKFTDTDSVDFILTDPDHPDFAVLVPLTKLLMRSHATVDAFKKTYERGSHYPHHLSSLTNRHGVHNTGHVRFRESSFDINEDLCILAVVSDEVPKGVEYRKIVQPLSSDTLTDAFFEKNEWTEWDKRSWADMTKEKCVFISDAKKHTSGKVATATTTSEIHNRT